ncbi:beta-N-acetylhexosaminidase [Sphingomonas mollis]|uniref:beta-N-acetylhexosaminidase n=1 Tax=Sphingomonas mollis TaxID=2795726 RepID=A0ABS0XKU6_9SPHN|nr:beta-N-acetylhexosaminidase [Sphingomonas sp. BT553]MBJ6120649.1 beta-N-acetylhexosaminidase [Sphingomonas sp. BT553]
MTPMIVGLNGPTLSPVERAAFAASAPAGFILFARNVIDPVQLRALTDDLRMLTGRDDLPILIDQEGGAVARLRPPEWPAFPAPARFAALYEQAPMSAIQAMRANGEAIGLTLAAAGITMNAAPMLDLAYPDADPALADRALGAGPMQVAALARAMLEGLAIAGVTGIVKHMPGHGRATVDPHHALPIITATAAELDHDMAPFRTLAHARAGMTAHAVFTAWDAARPATLSPTVIDETIRGTIGFDGLLLSDDLHMNALTGDLVDRAMAAVAAGCDLALCCRATPDEAVTLAAALPPMSDRSRRRLHDAISTRATDLPDPAAAIARCNALLALA